MLIDFPRFEAVTYSPEAFEKLIGNFEQDIETHHDTLQMLWIKQARLYKAMHKWDACLTVLIKIAPSAKNEEELNFLKGLSNYKMENFVQSRVYFDWFIKKYADQNEPGSQNQYFEQSKYFIKAMDTNTSRRSRFTVIKGKK